MPPFDREGALKSAEKALRQGRIDAAIAEYVRIVAAQPRDWNSANALGDLYIRANLVDKAVGQYTRIADHLAEEGFYGKALALYKKILKIKPDDEHSLLKSADMSVKQGRLADAKTFLKTVADRRRGRGDRKGAADITFQIGTLDPDDLEARLGAAKVAAEAGDTLKALEQYKEIALRYEKLGQNSEALKVLQLVSNLNPQDDEVRSRLFANYLSSGDISGAKAAASDVGQLKQIAASLEQAGKVAEALDVLGEIAKRDPEDSEIRKSLAQAYAAQGDFDRAREYLTPETAGRNASLWLMLAEMELAAGRVEEGRAAISETLSLDPTQREAIVALGCRLAEKSPEAGYPCIDAVADAALTENDYGAAAAALHEFVTRVRYHVIALMRLVDVCVDGGLESTMYEAQAQLADAYLDVGRGLEARIISEDLVAREPWNRANIERFRRALVMLGEADPDSIIAERLSGESPFLATDKIDLNDEFENEKASRASRDTTSVQPPESRSDEPDAAATPRPEPPARVESGVRMSDDAAAEQYRLALTYRDLGMVDDAVKALEAAARSARQRFDACSLLGRLYIDQGDTAKAVEWFERAAEAPAPTPDANRALLYDLAETLEKLGEPSRALAVFVELESESGGYRDVARRIERLSQPRAKR